MQEKLSEIEKKIENEKQKTHVTQCTTRRSLATLCEFLETYELDAETESEQEEQVEVAVAIEPASS
jgi:hypothetical protein